MIRLFLLLTCCWLGITVHGSELKVYVHGVQGGVYTDSSGQLRGKHHLGRPALLVELARGIITAAAAPSRLQLVERSEAIERLASEPNAVVVDLSRQETRAMPDGHWLGPLLSDSIDLLGNRRRPTLPTSLRDARQLPVCVRNTTDHAERLQMQGFTRIIQASSYRVCWDKLIAGEVAFTTLNRNLIPTIRHLAADISPDIMDTGLRLHEQDSYMVFSPAIPAAQVQQWRDAFMRIRESDDYQSLIHHFYCQQDCF